MKKLLLLIVIALLFLLGCDSVKSSKSNNNPQGGVFVRPFYSRRDIMQMPSYTLILGKGAQQKDYVFQGFSKDSYEKLDSSIKVGDHVEIKVKGRLFTSEEDSYKTVVMPQDISGIKVNGKMIYLN